MVWFLWVLLLGMIVIPRLLEGKKPLIFQVTDVSAAVTPSQANGECPQQFLFAGKITATGKGVVMYCWERSDGQKSPNQSIKFPEAGTEIVTTIWELGETGKLYSNYWQVLHVLSPQKISSNEAVFTLDCRGQVFSVPYKDIDVSDIFLDKSCRLWIKHTNRGTEALKVMVREKVWIDNKLVENVSETIMLEPGTEVQHKVGGEPGYMVFYNANVKVEIDADNVINELSEKNNVLEVRVFCKREDELEEDN